MQDSVIFGAGDSTNLLIRYLSVSKPFLSSKTLMAAATAPRCFETDLITTTAMKPDYFLCHSWWSLTTLNWLTHLLTNNIYNNVFCFFLSLQGCSVDQHCELRHQFLLRVCHLLRAGLHGLQTRSENRRRGDWGWINTSFPLNCICHQTV